MSRVFSSFRDDEKQAARQRDRHVAQIEAQLGKTVGKEKVIFRVGNPRFSSATKEMASLRVLISAKSVVFDRMLNGNMYESQIENIVEISEFSPNAFESFTHYCYHGNGAAVLTDANIVEMTHIADKYIVDDLKYACIEFIASKAWYVVCIYMYNILFLFLFFVLYLRCFHF